MTIEQTIEVPANHRIMLEVPTEVPAGKATLTFTVPECVQEIWPVNHISLEEVKEKLQDLRCSLGKDSFGNLDGVAYQNKVRNEWDD